MNTYFKKPNQGVKVKNYVDYVEENMKKKGLEMTAKEKIKLENRQHQPQSYRCGKIKIASNKSRFN